MKNQPTTDNRQPTTGKKIVVLILSLVVSGWLLVGASQVLAQTDYTLLAPIDGYVGDAGGKTQANSYLEGIFILAIAVAGGLAVIMIIWGGIQYMSTDAISGKSEAKNTIQNAIWGLLLAISAWLILNTINPNLVKFDLSLPKLGPGGTTSGVPATVEPGELTNEQALALLAVPGIDIADGIDLSGTRPETIAEILAMQKACGCEVTVNSTTSGIHSVDNPSCSHVNGYKVDLNDTSGLNSYITTKYKRVGTREEDKAPLYQAPSGGAIYARESDHWDVAVC